MHQIFYKRKLFLCLVGVFFLLYIYLYRNVYDVHVAYALPETTKKGIVVTAFYDIPNKKGGPSKYYKWFVNFYEYVNNVDVIIYVNDSASQQKFENIILSNKLYSNVNMTFVILPLEDTWTFHLFTWKEWQHQYDIDYEKYQSSYLYIVWTAKIEFIMRTMSIVQTDYYIWLDIGMIREKQPNIKFPQMGIVEKYCTGYICVNIVNTQFLVRKQWNYIKYNIHTGAGMLLGDVESWIRFNQTYYPKVVQMQQKGYFIGKEQNIYAVLINENPTHFKLLCSDWYLSYWIFEDWFLLLRVFGGLALPTSC